MENVLFLHSARVSEWFCLHHIGTQAGTYSTQNGVEMLYLEGASLSRSLNHPILPHTSATQSYFAPVKACLARLVAIPVRVFLGIITVCLAFTGAGAKSAEPVVSDSLAIAFHQAYEAENFMLALEIAEQLNDLAQFEYIGTLYNVAAMHCRLGHTEEAYSWLEKCLATGFWNFRHLREDGDFQRIREEKRFRKLVRSAWAKQYIAMLEREDRTEFQKPDEVMKALALLPGERVADIGAGSGYFTIPVAQAVGPEGLVWAIDIRQEMLDYLRNRLEEEQVENVRLMLVDEDDPQLPAGRVDTILMIDTLHYIQERAAYAAKLRVGLAPGGRIVIIDYRPKSWEERPWGPPPEQQISREQVDTDFATAGLKPVRVHEFLPEQYFVEYMAE